MVSGRGYVMFLMTELVFRFLVMDEAKHSHPMSLF
jgi:hypothetical protein